MITFYCSDKSMLMIGILYIYMIHSGYWIGRSKQVGAMAHHRCCQTDIDGMLIYCAQFKGKVVVEFMEKVCGGGELD